MEIFMFILLVQSGFTRFCYMNLFMVSMLLLVMGNNYVVLFIGWEGVGLCSYLLIGYYYDKVSAAKAATKAFVVNRIGDAGFLMAIFLVFVNFRTLDYAQVMQNADQLSPEMATAIALCLLSAPSENPPNCRSTPGCPMPWKARPRSAL